MGIRKTRLLWPCFSATFVLSTLLPAQTQLPPRWTTEQANGWYSGEPWLVGSNYIPADAINQLEMWQASTFDPKRIDKELGWAEGLGMNTMRVFLHDLLWKEDPEGFKNRIDQFLTICEEHKIRPIFVLFDSCWDPNPHLGKQHKPTPGVHNSGWVQSPGRKALEDPSQYPRLEAYVKGVVGAFGHDKRVLAWDIWNEPDNLNESSYRKEEPANKVALVLALLPQTFAWARSVSPEQPLTSAPFHGDWENPDALDAMTKTQLELSDVISFHNYDVPADFEKRVKELQRYRRPVICTEYMARAEKSTFQGILPIAKEFKVGALNWGFVAGKTQTYLPWDSWKQPYVYHAPTVWFHDIFHANGKPYRPAEVAFIRKMTGATNETKRKPALSLQLR
ncbi:MAG: 1,4-beta-xylanase [Acidobacteriaceae bacterium]|nr:1,4-beta-xylanase [Acidobacteriaceae bacterium]